MKTLIITVILLIFFALLYFVDVKSNLFALILWIKKLDVVTGSAMLTAVTAVITMALLPNTLLCVAGGYLYGTFIGTAVVQIGCMIPAILSFYLGKTYLRSWVENMVKTSPKLRALDAAVAKNSMLIIFLARLSPVFPFSLLNYMFGVFRVQFSLYTFATFLGILPSVALYAYLGSQMGDLEQIMSGKGQGGDSSMVIAGLVATVAVVVVVTYVTRKALMDATKEFEQQEMEQQSTKL